MKINKLYILAFLSLVLVFSCNQNDLEDKFDENELSGWVDFDPSANSATVNASEATTQLAVPFRVNVPAYPNGLNVSYRLEAVSGDFTPFVTNTSGTEFVDPYAFDANDRIGRFNIGFINLDVIRSAVITFDVIITNVDVSSVGVGVDDSSVLSYRVTIPCTNPDVLPNDFFVGEYTLADVTGTIGPSNGTSNFEAGTVTLAVDVFNPNLRNFTSGGLPAFTGGTQFAFSLLFSDNDTVTLAGFTGLNIACGAGAPEYGFDSAAAADSASWDICNDQEIVITYTEDPLGSCGGPFLSSFVLTKI